ncbi:MAG: FtsW/RodA/SpoVE family cell cycle protein [Lachnospiraceae bacterium]|nr:FtsW/RodA/SpoVE family cell cycle protein [Lachnospiraceae bacterium]
MHALISTIKAFLDSSPHLTAGFTVFVRYALPVLSFTILSGTFLSLFSLPRNKEVFARLELPDDSASYPVNHMEALVGRSGSADIVLGDKSVNRLHAAVSCDRRDEWKVYDNDSRQGTYVNGEEVTTSLPVQYGDTITFGTVDTVLRPVGTFEEAEVLRRRRIVRPLPPWTSLLLLTILQGLLCIQLCIAKNAQATFTIVSVFVAYTALMWVYFTVLRLCRITGFELEIIAFYLTSICLSVTTSCNWTLLPKQLLSVPLGILLMFFIGRMLGNLDRIRHYYRWIMAAVALGLMASALLLGSFKNGATNWIHIGGFSFQPSELAKLCYVFAGSATLDRLFRRRNLGLFLVLSFAMIASLAMMNDFGTASIFFMTFLVISFLRSGDFATLLLMLGGAVSAGTLVLAAKPYIWARFSTWRHAMEYASEGGYQQARTMTAIASGGLLGTGPGGGFLKRVAASDTDLVFGMMCEELGLITAVFAVLCIIALSAFAIRSAMSCRSSFYMIAACSATTMLIFQTALNVFGCTDLLPLTGVTFPFVSNGGSSMLLSWGLLAFLKAADTRPGASFVFRRDYRDQRRRLGVLVEEDAPDPDDYPEELSEEEGDDE